jgi:hypothetical protein
MDKAEYQRYLRSPHWQKVRAAALARAGNRCQGVIDVWPERPDRSWPTRCGQTRGLQVHHKTYERLGREAPQDVFVLCDACHEAEHFTACAGCGIRLPIDHPHDLCEDCWMYHND